MRASIVVCAGVLAIAVSAACLLDARAEQQASMQQEAAEQDGPSTLLSPVPGDDGQPAGQAGPHMMRGWMGGGPAMDMGPPPLGLIYDAPDKQLSAADVQKIAEAFLLWHGNHSWKVVGLSDDGDRVVFSIATTQNAAVARFAMNKHSGKIQRLG